MILMIAVAAVAVDVAVAVVVVWCKVLVNCCTGYARCTKNRITTRELEQVRHCGRLLSCSV